MNDIQKEIDELSAQLSAAHEEYKNKTAELSFKVKHSKRAQKLQKLLDRIEDESGIICFETKQKGPFWTSSLGELSTKLADLQVAYGKALAALAHERERVKGAYTAMSQAHHCISHKMPNEALRILDGWMRHEEEV